MTRKGSKWNKPISSRPSNCRRDSNPQAGQEVRIVRSNFVFASMTDELMTANRRLPIPKPAIAQVLQLLNRLLQSPGDFLGIGTRREVHRRADAHLNFS